MQIQQSYQTKAKGVLYLIPTPIGNLEDITLRALRLLEEVDVILAEDTRHTRKLLTHYELSTALESYHEHSSNQRVDELIERLTQGETMGLVSDAGSPLINDPGHPLVAAAVDHQIAVIPLPGANAALTALMGSNLSLDQFTYYGFFPRKRQDQQDCLKQIGQRPQTAVFYESPYRLVKSLTIAQQILGDEVPVVVCRELTKQYEEFARGSLGEVLTYYQAHPPKGEVVWLIQGGHLEIDEDLSASANYTNTDWIELIDQTIAEQSCKPNQAMKQIARDYQISRNQLYAIYHELD